MDSLRVIRRLVVGVGASASVGLMWATGRRNPSVLLLAMFAVWVVMPYAAILAVEQRLDSKAASARTALTSAALLVMFSSIGVYGFAFVAPPAKPAAPFLMLPIVQLLVVAGAWFVGRPRARPHVR